MLGPSKDKDDRMVLDRLGQLLKNSSWSMVDSSVPEVVKSSVSTCDVFIGSRMHANIAALSSGIPVIALAYSHKSLGIMKQFGLEDFVIDASNISRHNITTKLNGILSNYDELAGRVHSSLKSVRQSSVENMRPFKNLSLDH